MKEFDLKAALNGEPVMLKNGQKAVIKFNILDDVKDLEPRDAAYPLFGYRFNEGHVYTLSWDLSGESIHWAVSEYNIAGMWEEPKLTTEEIMDKAFDEGLVVSCLLFGKFIKKFKIVAKTTFDDYVLQDINAPANALFLCALPKDIEWSIEG